ncbi:MAG: class I SAM-dependent methyltransferase, partial [Hyphomicrobiales bacterium]|nr:class I SAM-dependent methyltransferase [Hyphomicrobiales bacterium]
RFVGYDLGEDAIAHARGEARAAGLSNIRFEARDLTGYDEINCFDFITTFDAVHDQKDPQGLIRGLHGALRSGGRYLMQDIGGSAHLEKNIDFPMAAFLYAVSLNHCMPVSLGQGGAGLGTMWGWETAQAMLEDAGFASIARNALPHDPMNVWFVSSKA